jgi:DNA-binding transcriptional LysR family regulator
MLDLARLKLFVQVAELGSLSKVAGVTGVGQPIISRKITALEKECGGRLFSRTGRGVILTQFGQRILPQAKALLEDVEKLNAEMKSSAGVPVGTVRIGIMPSLAHPAVSILLRTLRSRHPGVHLYIMEGSGGQIDEWLSSGRVDFAVLFRYGASAPEGEEPLGIVDTYLVGRTGDRVTSAPQIDFSKLDGLPLILPGIPNGLRVALARVAQQKQISLSVVMEADSLPIQKNIAASGDAYAVLGGHSVGPEVSAGKLQASCIVNPGLKRTIVLTSTTARPSTLACREAASLTRRIFEDLVKDGNLRVAPMTENERALPAPDRKRARAQSASD